MGTTFVYRRNLIFGPEPLWFVCTKLDDDRWVRAQSPRSIKAALAVVSGASAQMHEAVLDDCNSKELARLLTPKEVEADGQESHVGLFVGQLAADGVPRREAPDRPDSKGIARAYREARTPAGAEALASELARFERKKGASKADLAALDEVLRGQHPDLLQLLRWSDGHPELELMTVAQMLDVNDSLEREGLFVLNDNDNGDYWGLVTSGPLKGALFYDDYDLRDPPAEAVKANSLLDWLKQLEAE